MKVKFGPTSCQIREEVKKANLCEKIETMVDLNLEHQKYWHDRIRSNLKCAELFLDVKKGRQWNVWIFDEFWLARTNQARSRKETMICEEDMDKESAEKQLQISISSQNH